MSIREIAIPVESPTVSLRAVVKISARYMRVAALATLERGGVEVFDLDDGTLPLITDDHRCQSQRTILIVNDTVGAAQAAVAAVLQRRLGAVVSRHEPDHLLLALSCMDQSMLTIPTYVLDLAESAPELGSRQLRILSLVSEGMANNRIAERLSLSEPTVKREISDLFRVFDCSTRIELAMKAAEVGYGPG